MSRSKQTHAITVRLDSELFEAFERYRRHRQQTAKLKVSKQRAAEELFMLGLNRWYQQMGWRTRWDKGSK